MCGITGFLNNGSLRREDARAVLQRMTDAVRHRGPSAEGFWQSSDGFVNLGHRRLAIIDLTPTGAQPMRTPDGRYTLSYNGEIYNFAALRKILAADGVRFHGTSDTEVLLASIARWGVADTLPKLNGMFAFALWDECERKLWLARDRFGEKPVYYAWHDGVLLFGSELKALAQHPAFRREIDPSSVELFMQFVYVPAPHCIFKNAWKLPAGHSLEIVPGEPPPAPVPYWTLHETIERREMLSLNPDDPALIDLVDGAVREAVRLRMASDVPLGAFLSGGIDSSVVVALMQAQSSRPIKTFTIGFWETGYNEAEDASRVARHLGTEHHELYLSNIECLDVVARLPEIYDEPFADSSQIPTALVSHFTSKHVTVALSGDGGDEFWGGYNRYAWSKRLWPRLQRLSPRVRSIFARTIQCRNPTEWDRLFKITNRVLPSRLRVRGGGEKLHKLAAAMEARSPDGLYASLVAQWSDPGNVLIDGGVPDFLAEQFTRVPENLHYVERMMYLDAVTYMAGDILCKVDRASMASSLEARVPFLDNELVELAWRLPLESKIHKGTTKWPLRQVLKRYVPEELFNRPKMGFGIPIVDWLRGPMRDWAEDLLNEKHLREEGYFRVEVVRKAWTEHLSGRRNLQHQLWCVLMFQAWKRQWMGGSSPGKVLR